MHENDIISCISQTINQIDPKQHKLFVQIEKGVSYYNFVTILGEFLFYGELKNYCQRKIVIRINKRDNGCWDHQWMGYRCKQMFNALQSDIQLTLSYAFELYVLLPTHVLICSAFFNEKNKIQSKFSPTTIRTYKNDHFSASFFITVFFFLNCNLPTAHTIYIIIYYSNFSPPKMCLWIGNRTRNKGTRDWMK